MKCVQGLVVTRDRVFKACGVDETDARQILLHLWCKQNDKLISDEEFIDKIEFSEITIGAGSVEPNNYCFCHLSM